MKRFLFFSLFFSVISTYAQPIEKLEYKLRYSFINGGIATLQVNDTTYNGQKAIHYYMEGNTIGLPDKLFSVHDIYESIVDPETNLPYVTIRNVKERKYRYYNETTFFNDNDSIFSQRSGGKKVPHNLVDILTSFFYLRNNSLFEKLDEGEEFTLPVFHADEHFMLTTYYLGTEKVKTDLGEIECYVVSPHVSKGKLLKRSDGLKFYISKDTNNLPILLEFDMNIGALKCELLSFEKEGVKLIVNK